MQTQLFHTQCLPRSTTNRADVDANPIRSIRSSQLAERSTGPISVRTQFLFSTGANLSPCGKRHSRPDSRFVEDGIAPREAQRGVVGAPRVRLARAEVLSAGPRWPVRGTRRGETRETRMRTPSNDEATDRYA